MITTEEEAKTKRCQESFAARITTDGGGNIYQPLDREKDGADFHEISAAPRNCIGSGCMAWRWDKFGTLDVDPERGYCGKAGKP